MKSRIFLFALVALVMVAPACERQDCLAPNQWWVCPVKLAPTDACAPVCSGMQFPTSKQVTECAADPSAAMQKAVADSTTAQVTAAPDPVDPSPAPPCWMWKVMPSFPPSKPQTGPMPGCTLDASDNPCSACVKTACCAEYQGCASDANCLCWVGCKFAGNTDDICAQADHCGALSPVSSVAAACLDANCPAECGTMATMTGACMCGSTGTGAGGGAPSCTPGSFGPGESCFSDGDCMSCVCNTGTGTCD